MVAKTWLRLGRKWSIPLLLLGLLMGAPLHAQTCLVVTPTGSGDQSGTDWSNARAGLSGLVRGDTYYLARGQYGKTTLNTAISGTTLITVRAADASDHCTETGWNEVTMAATATSPAFFRNTTDTPGTFAGVLNITTSYWVIEGTLACGRTQQCNLKINNTPPEFVQVGISMTTGLSNITIRRLETEGVALFNEDPANDVNEVSIRVLNGSDLTFQQLYLHHFGQVGMTTGNLSDVLVEDSYFFYNYTSPTVHGNAIADQGSTNFTIRYNVFQDIEGTAYLTVLNRGGGAQTADNRQAYGNVFLYTSGNPNNQTGTGRGIFTCINGENCPNNKFYNNTIVNITTGNAGLPWDAGPSSDVDVRNNLWFSCGGPLSITLPAGSTEDFNTVLNCPTGEFTGANDVLQSSGASNPLIDWPNGNFRLVAPTAAGDPLAAPFNEDPDGKTRGADGLWDRGAFEFEGVDIRPAPPTNLRTIVR